MHVYLDQNPRFRFRLARPIWPDLGGQPNGIDNRNCDVDDRLGLAPVIVWEIPGGEVGVVHHLVRDGRCGHSNRPGCSRHYTSARLGGWPRCGIRDDGPPKRHYFIFLKNTYESQSTSHDEHEVIDHGSFYI